MKFETWKSFIEAKIELVILEGKKKGYRAEMTTVKDIINEQKCYKEFKNSIR